MQPINLGVRGVMADSVVAILLDKLTTLLLEEVNALGGVKEEIENIRDEFDRMTAFLQVADAIDVSDPELRVWVNQIQDVAYDAEIVLDKFMLRASQNQYRAHKLFNGSLFNLVLWVGNLRFNRGIASEIIRIKARIQSIAEGHMRYRYELNMPPGSVTSVVVRKGPQDDQRGDCDSHLLEEAELVGIKNRKIELVEWILKGDDSRLKVVSVVGMGGLGKTTLVRKVFDDVGFRKRFQTHAWVDVSQSFKVQEILREIVQQLFDEMKQPVPQGVNFMDTNRLKETIKKFLQHRKYVVVFDDIWRIQAWEAVKYALPNNNYGSRVIITTRNNDVASYSSSEPDDYVHNLQPLSPQESWTLFCRKAIQGSPCPPHLERICASILKRCGGLPLAIIAIAGVLATKEQSRIEDWLKLDRSLGAELQGNSQLERLRAILSLSFNDLPCHLKTCFLYLSIFPEESIIGRNRLIRMWIMEGFVKPIEGRTLEDVAGAYLNELVNRNLIAVDKFNVDASVKLIRIHDFFRQMISSTSREQGFAITANDQTTSWPQKIRRLAIHGTLDRNLPRSCSSHLRSFHVFGELDARTMAFVNAMLARAKMATVVDLTGAPLETFPNAILQMFHLRYLSLRGTQVSKIPKSIQKLQKLETLDLKNTNVSELPAEILKLQHLKHLLVYRLAANPSLPFDHFLGFKALKGIQKLASLKKLCFMEVTPESGVATQISMLQELKRLAILKLKREDGKALCSSIEKLQKLRSLSIQSIAEEEILDVQHLISPPPFLQRLYLSGRLTYFPQWIQSLHSLVKLYLRWSRLEDDPLPYLQDLPNLIHLKFQQVYIGAELIFKAGKFQRLELLDLDKLEPLTWLTVEKGSMPRLEKLLIQRCRFLESLPTGIEGLANLKVLEFSDMPVEFIVKLQTGRLGEDHCKFAHIPQVNYTYWRDGGWETYPLDSVLNEDHSFCTPKRPAIRRRIDWLDANW